MWRNVYGHAIYQIIILVVVIFVSQGLLCETYDVKCLKAKIDNRCPPGALNPFYSSKHYFELGTYDYWTVSMKDRTAASEFDPDAYVQYQCD
jgi:hypothetical protein